MAKANGPTAGINSATSKANWRQMAQPLKPVEQPAITEALIGGPQVGHNLVIDRTDPEVLSIHVPVDEAALANILQAKASKEKLAKDPKAVGARYLARTVGGLYGTVNLDIGGRRFYLKLTLEEARAKN